MNERRARATGLALAISAAAAAALIADLIYGFKAGWECFAILAPVGAVTVLATGAFLDRARPQGIRRQLAITGAIAVGQLLIAAALFAALMTVTPMDALMLALVAAYAGTIGAWAARAASQRISTDVEALRRGLEAIAAGERDVPIEIRGGGELALVARDVEALAATLHDEEHARERLETARRHLLAAVSHDLRTPVTSLRLLAEALDDDVVDPANRREYMTRIGTHVRALGALIDDLFELTRLEAGDIRWTIEHVPLADLVSETVDAMRPEAEASAVSVQADLPAALLAARANPEQIQRVLFNLIQNAIRHTPADGSVTVRAEPSSDAVEIEVADTGEGIAAAQRERVFEPFHQDPSRAARSDGSAGLGLAISRAIVEAHGGRIWLEDAAVGTRVRFSLPRD